jgi:hypothetical protein
MIVCSVQIRLGVRLRDLTPQANELERLRGLFEGERYLIQVRPWTARMRIRVARRHKQRSVSQFLQPGFS